MNLHISIKEFIRLIILVSIAVSSNLFAQHSIPKFDNISLEQGLSQSTVYSIAQDSKGFMWFGTQDGLNRYDGYSINVFKHHHNDSSSISDNTVWSLQHDDNGIIWIGTLRGGVNKYNINENKFYKYKSSDDIQGSISDNFITCIFKDSRGRIWIGTYSGGLNLYLKESDSFIYFKSNDDDTNSINSNTIWSIVEDINSDLWIATNNGLAKLNQQSIIGSDINKSNYDKIRFTRFQQLTGSENELKGNNIQSLAADRNGYLWIGTYGNGLNRLDINKMKFKHFYYDPGNSLSLKSNMIRKLNLDLNGNLFISTYDAGLILFDTRVETFNQFSDDVVMSLYQDRSNIVWIGTFTEGIKMYDINKNRFQHYYDDPNNPNDLSGNYIFSILEDSDGELWVGTHGFGLNRFNSKRLLSDKYYFEYGKEKNINNNTIRALYESKRDGGGLIWIGTFGGGLNQYNKTTNTFSYYVNEPDNKFSLSSNDITTLFEDSHGILWIGNNNGEINLFNPKQNKFVRFKPDVTYDKLFDNAYNDKFENFRGTSINSILEDSRGQFWIGTIQGGLFHYDPVSGKTHNYLISETKNKSVNNNGITSLFEDIESNIWIGTFGGGLNKFNYDSKEFEYFTEQEGLPNNVIYGILSDKYNKLWISTNNGITKFDPCLKSFRNFDIRDGLQSNEFNHGSFFASTSGELFFGGMNGFNSFFPDLIIDNDFIPPVYFTTFKIFNEELPLPNPIPEDQVIELVYNQNFFSFEFVALNFTAPEKNKYAYKLDGFDNDWHFVPASQRYASYTNLDPGDYTLRVIGSNNDGIWNEAGALLNITIAPPFWMTWWFRCLLVIFFIGSAITIYNYRVGKIRKMDLMRLRIARDLHDEVGSDLGGIALISQRLQNAENLPNKVSKDLSEISKASFQTSEKLRDIVWFVNPEHDKSEHLVLRLKDLAGYLLKDIRYNFFVDSNVNFESFDIEKRRQIYLIFKEVLYNVVRHAKAGNVEIKIITISGNLKIEISDDGIGLNKNKKGTTTNPSLDENLEIQNHGMGIKNIFMRADLLNAKIDVDGNSGQGTIVKLLIPIP